MTGGAGFIGSHLCDRLVTAGHEVICCDNYVTGNEQNIQHLQAHLNFTILQQDVRELKPLFAVRPTVFANIIAAARRTT